MVKLLTVRAREHKTFINFRHLEKNQYFSLKLFEKFTQFLYFISFSQPKSTLQMFVIARVPISLLLSK